MNLSPEYMAERAMSVFKDAAYDPVAIGQITRVMANAIRQGMNTQKIADAERTREVFTRRLGLHNDQRAYSWHEVQDSLEEIEGTKR